MKAGEKFIIKSGAKDEKNRMFINFPAFIRTCFGFRQFNRDYERQNLYLSQLNLQMGKTLYQELY